LQKAICVKLKSEATHASPYQYLAYSFHVLRQTLRQDLPLRELSEKARPRLTSLRIRDAHQDQQV